MRNKATEKKAELVVWMDVNDDELTEATEIIREDHYEKIKQRAKEIKNKKNK